jgi:hypothetical protein
MRKTKRQATPEQIARRATQRAAVKQIAARIRAMSEADRINFANKYGLRHVDGHELSIKNQCLILFQNPHATVCGGFGAWIKAGRCVRKGEHGVLHWVPLKRKRGDDDTGAAETDDGERPGFILAPTFDVSQTKELGAKDDEPQEAASVDSAPGEVCATAFDGRLEIATAASEFPSTVIDCDGIHKGRLNADDSLTLDEPATAEPCALNCWGSTEPETHTIDGNFELLPF